MGRDKELQEEQRHYSIVPGMYARMLGHRQSQLRLLSRGQDTM